MMNAAVIVLTAGALALAGCSSGETTSGAIDAPATTPTNTSTPISEPSSSSTTSRTAKPSPSVPPGASAREIAKLARCTPTQRSAQDTNVGPKPKSDVVCKVHGTIYEIETWQNASDMAVAKATAEAILRSFHITTYSLVGDLWSISRYDTSTPAKERAAVASMQAKLGAGSSSLANASGKQQSPARPDPAMYPLTIKDLGRGRRPHGRR